MRASAQTGGPIQPEFSTPSVPSGAQVNTFTGGFSFGLPVLTVPGPNGSDYSLTLSYQSGTPAEQGASWVGYGWSLNPGAVVRDVKGFPDDWKSDVKIWNKINVNWTSMASLRVGIESASKDLGLGGKAAYSASVSYNNATGYRRSSNLGIDAKGLGDLGFTVSDGKTSFSGHVSPSLLNRGIGVLNLGLPEILTRTLAGTGAIYLNKWINDDLFDHEYTPAQLSSPHYSGSATNYGVGLLASLLPTFNLGPEGGSGGAYTERIFTPNYWLLGRGLMYGKDAGVSDMLDYFSEQKGSFRVDDNFLSIPFTASDNYFVSGGGPIGVLQLTTRRSPQFRPDYIHNTLPIYQSSQEITILARLGIGGSRGLGNHSLKIGQWEDESINNEYRFDSADGDETVFFRYGNDLGGSVLKAHDDRAVRAEIDDDGRPKVDTNIFALMNEGERSGRSIHIGYNLNGKLEDTTDRGVPIYAYGKERAATTESELIDRSESAIADQIGELAITSQGGYRYIYGLPVYARNEKRLNFGVGSDSASRIQSHHIIYSWVDTATGKIVIGEERNAPYATAHLLTLVTTPDYVDLTHDGPTPDDLGGYTKFNYVRTGGSLSKSDTAASAFWYHWRVPYRGLLYSRNSLSDGNDDLGSATSGEREQYYLESVETKTHIAIMVNNLTNRLWGTKSIQGSLAPRRDAYQAPYPLVGHVGDNYMMAAAGDSTASSADWYHESGPTDVQPFNRSVCLERIELYTKDSLGNPDSLLSTVNFAYDYSLRPGMPNAIPEHPDSSARPGMLTLRKLWVENQRVRNARISPYEFGYEYHTSSDYPVAVRQLYPEIASFADSLSSDEQNPPYSPLDIDRWGSYQYNGAARKALDNPWVDQHPDSTTFDPAAWQLKWIRMPSQGELQIQYEQADYSYVQDKPALAMVSLLPTFGSNSSVDGDDNGKYYLNLADLGVADTDRAAFFRYRSLVKRQYLDTNDRIFCRLLYALKGTSPDFAHPVYNSEYITAYANAKSVGVDSVTLTGGVKHYALFVEFGTGDYSVPKQVCLDFVKWNRRGRFQRGDPFIQFGMSPATVLNTLKRYSEAGFVPEEYCKAIDYTHSYLRIPMVAPKKGGGMRVKRLLTFDKGIEGDSSLYGTEYIYRTYDEDRREYVSSGVAANEPMIGREENALVNVDQARGRLKFLVKIIAGDDRAQYEGPIGESLLPGASVGYSRVVVRNIFPGKTNPGFAVQEFYTAKDFPFIRYDSLNGKSVDYTDIGQEKDPEGLLWNVLSSAVSSLQAGTASGAAGLGFSKSATDLKLTQGYRFILNSMHGQPKSSASYGGDFLRPDSWALSGLTQYNYFQPGEKIPVVDRIGDSVRLENPGKEMNVTFESRSTEDHTTDFAVNGDIGVPAVVPFTPISWSAAVRLDIRDNDLRTHVTSKVVRYPAIARSVLTYGDGVYHLAENVAFDPQSGAPLITRTVDGYDKLALELSPGGHVGAYHSYLFPTHQEYPLTGQKAWNERALIMSSDANPISKTSVTGGGAVLTFTPDYDTVTYRSLARLGAGDLVRLTKASDGSSAGFYHVASIAGNRVTLHPLSPTNFASNDTSTGHVNIEVIESGRSNEIGGGIASIVTYGESDSIVRTASNFVTVEPTEFAARRSFIDTLNAVKNRGGGFILPSSVSSLGVKFLKTVTSGDTCAALSDTLWLSIREGRVLLTRGAFTVTDSICGTPTTPHPMVDHLNHLLDSLWGHHIDTSFAAVSQCDSTTYSYRHYDTLPAPYRAFLDSMFTVRFDCVNYLDNYWIGDLVRASADMDTVVEGFKRGTNAYYSATGTIDLRSVLDNTWLTVRLWASECDTSGKIKEVSFRNGVRFFNSNPVDNTTTFNNFSKTQLDGFFAYTGVIGKFKENTQGYLQYQNTYGGGTSGRIFGIRFIHSDTAASRLVCSDTLVRVGGAGRFDLDDDGSLIYIAEDEHVAAQPIPCLEFCPRIPYRYKTIEGVIAASAGTLGDSTSACHAEYHDIPEDADPYERGGRGMWRSRIGYVYRTAVTGGSQHTSMTQRNYNNAGVFTGFRLFDFKHPAANDSTAWLKGDSVVRYSPNGIPLETRSPLGIRSALRLGYDDMLPVIAAANASYDAIAFASFEDDTDAQYVERGVAHSGRYACAPIATDGDITTGVTFKATQQIKGKGALVRFWMKTDGTIVDTGAATVELTLTAGTSTLHYPIRTSNKIARTGEWTLYEVVADNLTMTTGSTIALNFESTFTDTLYYVDDIKVGPADAVAVCYVYDGRTHRPIASFDNDHFGAYSQYNAEGRVVRTIVETARGIRTVAESHPHMPMVERPNPGDLMAAGRREGSSGYGMARRSRRPAPEVEESVDGTKVDLLDVEIGPDVLQGGKPKVKVLGGEKPKLPDIDRLSYPDSLLMKAPSAPKIPVAEQAVLVARLKDLSRQRKELTDRAAGRMSDEERKVLDARRRLIEEERTKLARQLGLSDGDLRSIEQETEGGEKR